MIEVVKLTADLLRKINPQPMQHMPEDHYLQAIDSPTGDAYCAVIDGHPIAAAGVVELWKNRGHAWALLGADAGPHMLAITRQIRCYLSQVPFCRIEMAVDAAFPAAVRWAFMLGFDCETPEPMRKYSPDGRDAYLFARVK